jgi:hypothetical protein
MTDVLRLKTEIVIRVTFQVTLFYPLCLVNVYILPSMVRLLSSPDISKPVADAAPEDVGVPVVVRDDPVPGGS